MYYAIARGQITGIVTSWEECKVHVQGFPNACYKKFLKKEEAEWFLLEHMDKEVIIKEPDYYVYTDGSCINNGKHNAKAGIGIYLGDGDPRNVSRVVEGKQTNNTAELGAILAVYALVENDLRMGKRVCIVTDSEYAQRCATSYGQKQANEGWKKDIPNKELVQQLYERYHHQPNITFLHVMAHTGQEDVHSVGNNHADRLANEAIGLKACPYQVYDLNVSFERKEEAKGLGARWNAKRKVWYVRDSDEHCDVLLSLFDSKTIDETKAS